MTQLIPTEDGSPTLFNAETGELYHNSAGAFTEALENYLTPSGALDKLSGDRRLNLLDGCFGLGYNTFTLLHAAAANGIAGEIFVTAIELDKEVIKLVGEVLAIEQLSLLKTIMESNIPDRFGNFTYKHQQLTMHLELIQADLRAVVPHLPTAFDLVFHDAFSPRKVPELWTVDLFAQYFRLLGVRSGQLLTYSSAGAVRGGLQQSRFHLYRTTGLGKKSGGTLASTLPLSAQRDGVFTLSTDEQQKLSGKSGIPYRDSDFKTSRAEILKRRADEQMAHPHLV